MSALWGRRVERDTLERLLAAVRAGQSAALVLRGEAGVGKTALLRFAIESASGLRVARAAGAESEMELPFAALHQLCAPMLDKLERIPQPQRDALRTAFGERTGGVPDRFLVGLAALSLLSETAADAPLLVCVDDAQWLDRASAQALAFVARRLFAESVGLLFATREQGEELRGLRELVVEGVDGAGARGLLQTVLRGPPDARRRGPSVCGTREQGEELRGLRELVVEGLDGADARELLETVMRGPLDARVRDRIVSETRGNPLALLELAGGRTAAEVAGGFGLPEGGELSGRVGGSFARRVPGRPPGT